MSQTSAAQPETVLDVCDLPILQLRFKLLRGPYWQGPGKAKSQSNGTTSGFPHMADSGG